MRKKLLLSFTARSTRLRVDDDRFRHSPFSSVPRANRPACLSVHPLVVLTVTLPGVLLVHLHSQRIRHPCHEVEEADDSDRVHNRFVPEAQLAEPFHVGLPARPRLPGDLPREVEKGSGVRVD